MVYKINNMKVRPILRILLCLIFPGYICSAQQATRVEQLQEGDILFQHLECGGLCQAIEAVTYGVLGKKFSHCALVVKINDTLKVIEAIGNKVQCNALQTFFQRSKDTNLVQNISVGRMKKAFFYMIPKAVEFCKKQIDQPYDDEFMPENGKWYCSELLYESFKAANHNEEVFALSPMTFKIPGSNDFFPAWVEYFRNLSKPIPEGVPGLNPGSISRSDKLQIIPLTYMPR